MNETDATRRRVALAALFTDDCEYPDPLATVSGQSALVQLIATVPCSVQTASGSEQGD